MYYVMRESAPSLHRESTDSLIIVMLICCESVCTCIYFILLLLHLFVIGCNVQGV